LERVYSPKWRSDEDDRKLLSRRKKIITYILAEVEKSWLHTVDEVIEK
jgi:hypothetical protein